MSGNDIDMIGTFGTGLPDYDLAEANGLRAVLGDRAGEIPALATKGSLGNNGAGSGAIDLCIAALCMQNSTIPPALNVDQVDPQCGLNIVTGDPVDANVNTILSVGYALNGGQNAALIFKRMEN
jgi:3-oxoacyl-[acyl-carrier-protein] synthase II